MSDDMDWQPADENQDLRPHLPECLEYDEWESFEDTDGHASLRRVCICEPLRACEQRVLGKDYSRGWFDGMAEGKRLERINSGMTLDAAREAVLRTSGCLCPSGAVIVNGRTVIHSCHQNIAHLIPPLAAIDALKGKQT